MPSIRPVLSRFIFALSALFCGNAFADYPLNMTRGVSPSSQDIYHLHMTILWVCVAIGVLVYGLMIYAIIRHRKSKGQKPATFHESTTVEIIWTIIPFVILIVMAVPATRVLIKMDDTSKAEVTILITGHRWYWQYDYIDEGINFLSMSSTPEDEINNLAPKNPHYLLEVDKPLVLPVGKKIRFIVTAKDVIHSWWVPALGVKKDAIPGFTNEMWTLIDADKPGTYRGQCAELCGVKHGFMPIVVEAKSPEEYQAWINEQKAAKAKAEAPPPPPAPATQEGAKEGEAKAEAKPASETVENKIYTKEELMAHGENEYNGICAMCHKASGEGMPPTFPSLVGSKIVTEKEHITEQIRQIIQGKNAMPPFGTMKSDYDIAAIVTYERNSWGNNTGDVVQPSDVAKVRELLKKKS
ncbi:MAG: cytochrome c oxidase subunit II [Candidatus Berkiella sp.]